MDEHANLGSPRNMILKEIIKQLDDNHIKRVLDIGCADGYITENIFMKHLEADFYGIEMGYEAEKAKQKGIKTFKMDLNYSDNLIFEDGFFDLIFAGEIIEHLINPDTFLEEVNRILSSDGILILTTPNLAAWYNRFLLLLGYQPFWTDASRKYPYVGKIKKFEGDGQHLRLGTYRSIKELLNLHGFQIKFEKGTFAENLELISVFRFIEKISWTFPSWSTGLIFVCEKQRE
jgi:SAM-dependent methyltransferase